MAKMKLSDRAKIFLPFDALKGFKAALREEEKERCEKRILSDEQKEELDNKIRQLQKGMLIKILVYNKEEQSYDEVEGVFTRLDIVLKKIYIVKQCFAIDDIVSLKFSDEKLEIIDF
ncbi:MAG: hypothetical protein ACI4U5_00245 [Bacilli bacterium]